MKVHRLRILTWALALAACAPRPGQSPPPEARLNFSGPGAVASALTRRALEAAIPVETVAGFDPYYQRNKRFGALPMRAVLARGFPGIDLSNAGVGNKAGVSERLVLRARDGYAVSVEAWRLLLDSAYLAIADLDAPSWEPIGPRGADPAPFYLIWKGVEALDLESYPRPWALAGIARATVAELYPHAVPPPGSGSAQRGFAIFRRECIRCHAINREGGRVGPDLNVPRSIIEYRPIEQIRAYIRDPQSFRYGAMPAHPHLSDADLDGLIAYFDVMRTHKYDPGAGKKGGTP